MEDEHARHCNAGGHQAGLPHASQGASTYAVVPEGHKRAGIHGDRQGATTSVALGYGEDGRSELRMRWVDASHTTESSAPPTTSVGGRREREINRTDVEG